MAFVSVLIVDDDAGAVAFARSTLEGAGYAVSDASCGRLAHLQIISRPPEVLITDILMPDGDGIELITAIRRACPKMIVIAVSDRRFLGGLDLFRLAALLGADATLEKPLAAETLLGSVGRLIAGASRSRATAPPADVVPDPPRFRNC